MDTTRFLDQLRQYANGVPADDEVLCQADRILKHELNVLGSGWVHNYYGMVTAGFEGHNYSDPTITFDQIRQTLPTWYREKSDRIIELIEKFVPDYQPIDWQIDLKSGARYDIVHVSGIKFGILDGVDAKMTADMSRGYQLVVLARAFLRTGDMRYRNELIAQFLDWLAMNPAEYGAAWRGNMNVAIRVPNVLCAFSMIASTLEGEDELLELLYQSMIEHRRYVSEYLEFTELPTSLHPNHYIANFSGLLILCAFMKPFDPDAESWERMAWRELKLTTKWQINADGVDFEATTMYHAFALEMLSYAWILAARLNGAKKAPEVATYLEKTLGEEIWQLLRKMFEAQRGLCQQNGRMPVVGDADSGRFLYLEARLAHDTDRTCLLAVGAELFDDEDLLMGGDPDYGAALALFDGVKPRKARLSNDKSIAFKETGFYIMKDPDYYAFICCSPIGTGGLGSHAHNDRLEVLLNVRGEDIIMDPGVYAYTASKSNRNLFRNVGVHATVCVDDKQPNRLNPPGCWWGYHDDTRCNCLQWEEKDGYTWFTGEHYAYNRLDVPVTHRRHVQGGKGQLLIRDQLRKAAGFGDEMTVSYAFTLGPNCKVKMQGSQVHITAGDVQVCMETVHGEFRAEPGSYAPMYGQIADTTLLTLRFEQFLPENQITIRWN